MKSNYFKSRFPYLYYVLLISLCISVSFCGPDKKKARDYFKEGISQFYSARYREAIVFFDKALKEYPDYDEAYYYRGSSKFNLKDVKAAMEDFNSALRVNPGYADAYATRGDVLFYLGKNDAACKDWKEAERLGKPDMGDKTRNCH